jgi:hypothetical protein
MRYSVFLSLPILVLMASAAYAEDKAPDWRALAVADIKAAYTETQNNHPGMYDPSNPGFPKLLIRARTEALALAERANSPAGFEASLTKFKSVLNDGHAGAYAELPEKFSPNIRWPGFVAAWRGNAMYVYKSAKGGPVEGAQITECDKTPVRKLVERKVFGFSSGIKVPGEWWSTARRLFVDDGNPFVNLPKKCTFQSKGQKESRALSWEPVPDYYQQWKNGSANGDLLPIGLTERAPGLFWLALPDFQPDDAGVTAYKKLYADVQEKRSDLINARAIVLDLRFNQGGYSNWSKILAQHLWGEERVTGALKAYFANTQTWWRPTADNLTEIKKFTELLETQGDSKTAELVKMFIPLFENAIAKGDRYLVEPDAPEEPIAGSGKDAPELKVPVYIVVPGQCASACLDAVDYFKRFPNTRLIGAPSSADSTYMEVRSAALPSGMGHAIIPMKMYVNRPRGNGDYYNPDIIMSDFDWSTGNFQKRIEADLAKLRLK